MLRKLMSSIVIGSIVLSMVGCTATKESDKQQAQDIINSTKQEQQVQPKEEEVKKEQEQPKQQPKVQPKEQPKQQQQSKPKEPKKKQNDNIDPGTGLAKVKDGTHLGEEADKQDKQIKQEEDDSVWNKDYCPECQQPVDDCICNGDDNTTDEWGNTLCPNCGWPKDNCICGKDVEKPETMKYEIHKGTDADGNERTDYTINGGYVDEDEFNNQMENFGK